MTPTPTAPAFGLTVEEMQGPPVDVWPDVWPAVDVFRRMLTQWRIGMSGPTGLDYAAAPFVMRMAGIARADWPQVFEDLRDMEVAALKKMREDRERDRGKHG